VQVHVQPICHRSTSVGLVALGGLILVPPISVLQFYKLNFVRDDETDMVLKFTRYYIVN
jgi:hypothetical protein